MTYVSYTSYVRPRVVDLSFTVTVTIEVFIQRPECGMR